MATSGSFYTNVGSGWRLQMEWVLNSQSIENNTSSITARLYWMSLGSPYTVSSSATKTCGIQYNDGSWDNYSAAGLADLSGNQKKLIHSKTFTINHNADGTGSFSLDGYFKVEVTLSGTYYGTVDLAQKSYALPTIPRASTPTLNDGTVYMRDQAVTIYTNRASTSFTHTLTYTFGSASGTIATGVGASITWTPSISLANQIPNTNMGTCNITCKTYSGGTLVGTKTISLILMVPSDIIPSVSISNTGVSLYNGYYVQNKSKVAVSLTDSGAYGSTISSRKTTVNGATYTSASFTTGVLTSSGTNTISTTVTDSRGRTKTVSTTISVTAYSNPQATSLTAIRSNSDGSPNPQGAYMKLTGSAVIASINSTNTKNTYIRYRPTGGSWTTAVSDTASYTPSLSAVVAADINSTFEVELITADYYTSASRSTSVSTAFVLMDFHESGTSMAIGKVAEGNGVLEVGGDTYIDGTITANFRPTRITSGENLNNYTTPGMYYCSLNADASNISNTPANVAFALLVEQHAGVRQTFSRYESSAVTAWVRNFYNGTWSSWVALSYNGHTHSELNATTATYSNTDYGYILFGPQNTSWAHIYTDRPAFYFNKELHVLGNKVWHNGDDSGWINLSLSGATAYSTGLQPRYRKIANTVFLEGEMKLTSSLAAGGVTTIGTLPSGYRPPRNNQYICQGSGNAIWLFAVNSNGTCEVGRYRNGETSASISTSTWLPFAVSFAV